MKTINTYYEDQPGLAQFIDSYRHIFLSHDTTAVLVQVFSGCYEVLFLEQLADEISTLLPSAFVIGTTTSGEIMNGEVSGLRTVLSFTAFQQTTLQAGAFHKRDQDDFSLGRHIAASLGGRQAKALILFGTGIPINSQQVLQGIGADNPGLLVAGGNAGTNSMVNPALVLCGRDIVTCGLAGVILEGDGLEANLYSHLAWQAIGKEMTITEAIGNQVYSINNIPAYQVYRRYLGIDKIGNFRNAMEFPLILCRDGLLIARTPMTRYKDDSISFGGDFVVGEKVRLSFGDVSLISEMISNLRREICRCRTDSIFVYSCESRRGFLQEQSDIETRPLQQIAPTAGFFTEGEYYHHGGGNQLLNATMTVLTLAEPGAEPWEAADESLAENACRNPVLSPYHDSVTERNSGVLKALTHLINAVTAELEAANQDLQYISLHDSLTELYNRTFFEQEMKRLEETGQSVGVIICDMDCLKLINDTLGHEAGDRMLRLLAGVLKESCRKEDVAARIGGDEFAVLAKGVEEAGLTGIYRRMTAAADACRNGKAENLLYFSAGFALKQQGDAKSLRQVFKDADNAMYQNKFRHKKQVKDQVIRGLERLNRQAVDVRSDA